MKGYRTVMTNIVMSLPLVLDIAVQLLDAPEVVRFIPEVWMPYYGVAMVVMNIFLRSITTTPMFKSH